MDSNWSDFLVTPPNLDSSSNTPIPDFTINSSLQAPSNYVISSWQYSNIFQPSQKVPQQSPQSNACCCCSSCFQENQQLPASLNQSNSSCDISDQYQAPTVSLSDNFGSSPHHSNTKFVFTNRNACNPTNDNNINNNGYKNHRNDSPSNYEQQSSDFIQPLNDRQSPPPSPNTINISTNKSSNTNSYQTNFNEIENRTLLITNLSPQMTLDEIKQVFDPTNNSKSIDTSNLKTNNSITIEYFDLRQAQSIKRKCNGMSINLPSSYEQGPVSVSFAPLKKIPDPRRPPNNGTIVVFHLPAGVTESHIENSFCQFGQIREIRGTPQKPGQRFIEFWDTRDAEAALNALNGKYVMGSKVSIEFSLPGGFRRNIQPQLNSMTAGDGQNKNNVFAANNGGSYKQGAGNSSNHGFQQNSSFSMHSNMQNKF